MDWDAKNDGFLMDWYAVIDVPRTATKEEIKKKFRQQQGLYHPDKYEHLAPEFQAQAAQTSELLNDAHKILSDDNKRIAYDIELKEWKGHLSSDGNLTIDLGDILGGHGEDSEQIVENVLSLYNNHNPDTFQIVEQLHTATAQPTAAIDRAYRDELEKKSLDLELREFAQWLMIGVKKPRNERAPIGYLESVSKEIDEHRIKIDHVIENKFQLAASGNTLLLESASDTTSDDSTTATALYKEAAHKNFDAAAEKILALATEHEDLIKKRFDLVRTQYFPKKQPVLYSRLITCLPMSKDDVCIFAWAFSDGNASQDKDCDVIENDVCTDEKKAREWVKKGYNVTITQFDFTLDLEQQLIRAAETHFYAYLESLKSTQKKKRKTKKKK